MSMMKGYVFGTIHDAKLGMQSWRVISAASMVGFLVAVLNVAVNH
jgi:hypothetical protein